MIAADITLSSSSSSSSSTTSSSIAAHNDNRVSIRTIDNDDSIDIDASLSSSSLSSFSSSIIILPSMDQSSLALGRESSTSTISSTSSRASSSVPFIVRTNGAQLHHIGHAPPPPSSSSPPPTLPHAPAHISSPLPPSSHFSSRSVSGAGSASPGSYNVHAASSSSSSMYPLSMMVQTNMTNMHSNSSTASAPTPGTTNSGASNSTMMNATVQSMQTATAGNNRESKSAAWRMHMQTDGVYLYRGILCSCPISAASSGTASTNGVSIVHPQGLPNGLISSGAQVRRHKCWMLCGRSAEYRVNKDPSMTPVVLTPSAGSSNASNSSGSGSSNISTASFPSPTPFPSSPFILPPSISMLQPRADSARSLDDSDMCDLQSTCSTDGFMPGPPGSTPQGNAACVDGDDIESLQSHMQAKKKSGLQRNASVHLLTENQISRLRDEELFVYSAAGNIQSAVKPRRNPHGCHFILIKTSSSMHANFESIAKLRWELALHEKMYAAERAASVSGSATGATSPSYTPMSSMPPHIRQLSDSRLALIISDPHGVTLYQYLIRRSLSPLVPPQTPAMRGTSVAGSSINMNRIAESVKSTTLNSMNAGKSISYPHASLAAAMPTPQACDIPTIKLTLNIANAVAHKLQQMHRLNVIHRSLMPSTILINQRTLQVRFLDLTSASLLVKNRAEPDLDLQSYSLTQWQYMSPEQSGKANRMIDSRSDLYSLGCIVHEMFTGRAPFVSNDILELIHSHLARAPPSIMPRHITPVSHPLIHPLMTVVAAMVAKLMAKQAEERYQSVEGVIHDLQQIIATLDGIDRSTQTRGPPSAIGSTSVSAVSSPVPFVALSSASASASSSPVVGDSPTPSPTAISVLQTFTIGAMDFNSTFRLSQRLYGREVVVEALIQAYARTQAGAGSSKSDESNTRRSSQHQHLQIQTQTATGLGPIAEVNKYASAEGVAPQLFLISGYSGVGKTSLVDELHRSIVKKRGLFASGKFDLYKRDSGCLLQAFKHLILHLMVQDAATWRVKIIRALGANASIMVDVIPELARLIGQHPTTVAKLSATDTANRFNSVFLQFVGALSSSSSPLTLFIDDLQWADSGSLALIKLLVSQDSAHLLLIGCYRDNEVGPDHALMLLINDVKSTLSDRVTHAKLMPLTTVHITSLIVDSFGSSHEDALPLAQLLQIKTFGNPFFLSCLLKSFYETKLLWFDFAIGEWRWNIDSMRMTPVQEDVVDILCLKMLSLSPSSQMLLQYASCSGNSFNLHTLGVITRLPLRELAQSVCELEQNGMMICVAHAHDLFMLSEGAGAAHDDNNDNATDDQTNMLTTRDRRRSRVSATDECDNIDIVDVANSNGTTSAPSHQSSASHCIAPVVVQSLDFAAPLPPSSIAHSSMQLASIRLRFAHDKVQASSYKLIRPCDLSSLHCTIAEQLLDSYEDHECNEYAIEIVGHINIGCLDTGCPSLQDYATDEERVAACIGGDRWRSFFAVDGMCDRVIALEIVAAKQAKVAFAYVGALALLKAAKKVVLYKQSPATFKESLSSILSSSNDPTSFFELNDDCWRDDYAFCSTLYAETATTFFLLTQPDMCQRVVEYTLSHMSSLADRSTLFELHVQSLNSLGKMQDGLDQGLAHLHELGVELMTDMTPELREWVTSWPDMEDESTYHHHPVFGLEETADPTIQSLLSSLAPALFYLGSPVFSSVVHTMLENTRRFGITPEAAFAFGIYAITRWQDGFIRENYALCRTAVMILDRYGENARSVLSRTYCAVYAHSYPWRRPLSECVILVERAWDESVVMSEWEWGNYLSSYFSDQIVISHMDLGIALKKQYQLLSSIKSLKLVRSQPNVQSFLDVNEALAGIVDANIFSAQPIQHTMVLHTFTSWMTRGMIRYFNRDIEGAVLAFDNATPAMVSVMSLGLIIPNFNYRCLAILSSCTKGILTTTSYKSSVSLPANYNAATIISKLAVADELIVTMADWASNAPHNFNHKLFIMRAERNRVAIFSHLAAVELMLPTMSLYDDAVDAAHRGGHVFELGLILELAGRFYIDCGRTSIAHSMLVRSYCSYGNFGSVLKCKQLRSDFPEHALDIAMNQYHMPMVNMSMMSGSQSSGSLNSSPFVLSPPISSMGSESQFCSPSSFSPPVHTVLHTLPESSNVSSASRSGDSHSHSGNSTSTSHHLHTATPSLSVGTVSDGGDRHDRTNYMTAEPPMPLSRIAPSHINHHHPAASQQFAIGGSSISSAASSAASASTRPTIVESLDASAILKSIASFSTETDQSKLLSKLMDTVLAVGSATRGVLVLEDTNHNWSVELVGSVDKSANANDDDDDDDDATTAATKADASVYNQSHDDADELRSSQSDTTGVPVMGGHPVHKRTVSNVSVVSSEHTTPPPPPVVAAMVSIESTMPISVFNFTINSIETVVSADPSLDGLWSTDPYFITHHPSSFLSLPVLKNGMVFGVLYLENAYMHSSFSSSQVQLLQLLCSQAAFSIENARLYSQLSDTNENLEKLVAQRNRELESLQIAMSAAENAMNIKSQFLSNMSHEIRTPMNAVIGIGRLLADTVLSLEQQQYVNMISNSGHLLLTIINDILDFSKIEAGQLKLSLAPHNVLDVVESAIMLCYEMASAKGLQASWSVDPSLPASLMIDNTRLQQILLNLLSNSIKFTKTGGITLTVAVRRVYTQPIIDESSRPESAGSSISSAASSIASSIASCSSPISRSRGHTPTSSSSNSSALPSRIFYEIDFAIKDTGIGITPEQLALLFQTFSQVQHMSGEYGGTGLGLVISKRLVQAMGGGDIRVESTAGAGSTFHFMIACATLISSAVCDTPPKPNSRVLSIVTPKSSELSLSAESSPPMHQRLLHIPSNVKTSSPRSPISPRSSLLATATKRRSQRHHSTSILPTTSMLMQQSIPMPSLMPTSYVAIHTLLPCELKCLANSRILYIGDEHDASESWMKLIRYFKSNVIFCSTVAQAITFLSDSPTIERRRTLTEPKPKSSRSASPVGSPLMSRPFINTSNMSTIDDASVSPPSSSASSSTTTSSAAGMQRVVDAIIVDLDSSSIIEDNIMDSLGPFAPLRVLFLFSKSIHSHAHHHSSSMGASMLPRSRSSSPHDSALPMPIDDHEDTPSPESAAGQSDSNQTMWVHPTPSRERQTSKADISDIVASAIVVTPTIVCIPVAAPGISLRRKLKKPFKSRLLLTGMVSLLSESLDPTSSTQIAHQAQYDQQMAMVAIGMTVPTPLVTRMESSDSVSSSSSLSVPLQSLVRTEFASSANTSSPSPSSSSSSASLSRVISSSIAPSSTMTSSTSSSSSSASGASNGGGAATSRPRIVNIANKYPLRILLAEDNLINQKMMVMLLRKMGYEIQVAINGLDALQLLERLAAKGREFEVECVLMDATMDVMDGMECTRCIRAQQLPQRIRPFIIAQTANVSNEYRTMCLDSGMDLFSTKPVSVEELVKCLKAAYAQHHPPSSSASSGITRPASVSAPSAASASSSTVGASSKSPIDGTAATTTSRR